ncbi:uncharacterized protein I206_101476 [Kwoniella pini CBS 10737]|uniref:Uncharacterized protein n=1 Tax=Kwoniella pini CBS 10737 TaxID=1296096 RepID=A0A1B9HWJ3_9TREE|nr:uncharacterized protein I206_06551 [Kwoniella pini CBS 10737]OCF47647.1 hypothetical protein I206_06551 [Kwoniella pini CBS 10737]
MTSLASSPSSSFIMSYRPTSPLSRPGSPLSSSYTKSRSTSPFPSHTHTHNNKSKSISSLPPHSIHRLTDTYYPTCQAGPSKISSSTLTRSSSFQPCHASRSTARSRIIQDENTIPNGTGLSRSSSIRSIKSKRRPSISGTISPSRLPSTDCVSYFPPFEDMGSQAQEGESEGGSDFNVANHSSSRGSTKDERRGHHVKGRSLGSIAGIMSASLSWGLSSISCTTPPAYPDIEKKDDSAVKALNETISNAANGKRRVLESFTLTTNQSVGEFDHLPSSALLVDGPEKMHKRRMKSEFEVDMVLSRSKSLGGRSGRTTYRARVMGEKVVGEEDIVESLLMAETPSRPLTTRKPRPNLRLPIPTLGSWRFPLGPSPPVTCLSPDIPLEAFNHAIDNPCSSTPSRLISPMKVIMTNQEEIDLIEYELSPSPTSSNSFEYSPSTPPKSNQLNHNSDVEISIKNLNSSALWSESVSEKELDLNLRRIGSRTSEMSCETIKQEDWKDLTPKPSKILKRHEGLSVI